MDAVLSVPEPRNQESGDGSSACTPYHRADQAQTDPKGSRLGGVLVAAGERCHRCLEGFVPNAEALRGTSRRDFAGTQAHQFWHRERAQRKHGGGGFRLLVVGRLAMGHWLGNIGVFDRYQPHLCRRTLPVASALGMGMRMPHHLDGGTNLFSL